jgi:L-fuconolactonase
MQITDAQVHIWTAGTPPPHHRQSPYGAADLLADMDAAGVDRVVLVPPAWDPNGNAPSLAAAVAHPDRFAVMGGLDLTSPGAPGTLADWTSQPGMFGVRLAFNTPVQRSRLIDRSVDWFWAAAEAQGLPVAILAPGLLPLIAEVAFRHPGLRLLVDHLAIPRGARGPAAFEHLPELLAIARYPNVTVKAAGLPAYAVDDAFPWPSLDAPLHRVFDAFGPDRIFWGTDLTRMKVGYRECVEMMTEGLPWLAGADLEAVMGQGVRHWLGWKGGSR